MFEQLEDKSLLSTVTPIAPSSHVQEGSEAIFYVTVDPPSSSLVTANYQTNPGTALQDTDYQGVTGSVTIYPGEPYAFVSIPTYHDFATEPGETFSLTITGATGATVGTPSSATITIVDVPPSPPPPPPPPPPPAGSGSLSITPTVSHNEGSNQGATTEFRFTVTLTGAVAGGFSLNYRAHPQSTGDVIPGKDYIDTPGTLFFAGTDGESHDLVIAVKQDYLAEFDERFDVWLESAFLANGNPAPVDHSAKGTGVIVNDDFADLRLTDDFTFERDPADPAPTITFPISLNMAAFEKDVIVSYKITPVDTTPNADYVATPAVRTVTIPAEQFGPTTSPFVTITNDIITEPTETLKLEIVSVAFADSSAFPGIRNYERNAYDFDSTLWTVTTDPFAIGTIFDDDKRQVTLTALAQLLTMVEGDDYYNLNGQTIYLITATYTGKTPALAPFDLFADLIDGTATFDDDYGFATSSSSNMLLHFSGTVGETHSFYVYFVGDWIVEANEVFTAKATNIYHANGNSGVTIDGTANSVPVTIRNDDTTEVSINERLLTGSDWYISEGNMDDPVVEIPLQLSQLVDVPVRVEFTIAGLGGWNLPATVPATNATGFGPSGFSVGEFGAKTAVQRGASRCGISNCTSRFWVLKNLGEWRRWNSTLTRVGWTSTSSTRRG